MITQSPQIARVIAEHKELYRVKIETTANTPAAPSEYPAIITGRQIHAAHRRTDYPTVGDRVEITIQGDTAIIERILPRKSILCRSDNSGQDQQIIAANIDVAFIVETPGRDYSLNRIERYLILISQANITPVIVINKADLLTATDSARIADEIGSRFPNIRLIFTSAMAKEGAADLASLIADGKIGCFVGSSGVGKSTLINALLSRETIKTAGISSAADRGRHTTTHRQLYYLDNGGAVIDNPGIREVGIAGSIAGFAAVYGDILGQGNHCKFTDCTHLNEPGCAVLTALRENTLDDEKYQNYTQLKKETDFYQMSQQEKRQNARKFSKMIKNYKKHNR